jgi:peptidoglycan/LPS O-acetylase OafA/YrhL
MIGSAKLSNPSGGRERKPLSPRLKASLDAARATAAIYVALHHAANHFAWPFPLRLTFAFGQEGVMIFFLLSGFVIYANERDRVSDVTGYLWRRIKRIYPCLIATMAISIFVALDNGNLTELFRWDEFFGTLAHLQDQDNKPGIIVSPFMGNGPLWSLSYEMLFYLIFPLAMWLWDKFGQHGQHILGAFSVICYCIYAIMPNHWTLVFAYFIAWWCGAMAAHAYMHGAKDFRAIAVPLIWLGGLCLLAAVLLAILGFQGLAYYPFAQMRHFLVSLAFVIILFGPIGRLLAKYAEPFAKPSAYLASISYGIYVFHVPILMRWDRIHSALSILMGTALLVAVSIVFDRWLTIAMKKRSTAFDQVKASGVGN